MDVTVMDTRQFFETIFGDAEGFAFLGYRDDKGELNQQKFIHYPEGIELMERFAKLYEKEDLYFSPMLYKVPRRKTASVKATPVIYADTDQFDPERFLIPPTINVESSLGHTQSYWVLDSPDHDPADVSRVARAIAHAHDERDDDGNKIGVDPGGWALTKLLRVPGTWNQKLEGVKSGETPSAVFVRDFNPTGYTLEEMAETYDPENVSAVEIHVASSMPTTIPDPVEILPRMSSIRKLRDLYSKEPGHDQDWSDTLYLFVSEMLREGFTPGEILSVGWNAQCNKYRRDGRPKQDFWDYDITRAVKDPANRPRSRADTEAEDLDDSERTLQVAGEGVAKDIENLIFSPEEIDCLKPTFVDDYVKWAGSKTDAPAPYHIAAALTIISLVLGEWGVGHFKYGAQRLGMFFTVLGETTETRKTTARNLMKKLIRMIEMGEEYTYIVTSDATEEALIEELGNRAHRSSLYDRDEVQKLINDIKGGKGYMSGFLETLNEMYDGWARGRLRSGKKSKDTPVNFVQFMMGIRSQFQDNLELADFASGWGPRNVFVRGESPPRTRENSRLTQGTFGEAKVDRGLHRLAKKLTDARDFWSKHQNGDRESPYYMHFEDEAWDRATDWVWDVQEHFKDHPRFQYLKPSLERMSINVHKVSILFAMMNQREEVIMDDVLNAQFIACQWVEDLIVIVEGVSESYELRHIRALEEFILSNDGLVSVAKALKWATTQGIRRRDFWDTVDSLTEMNIAKVMDDTKGVKCLSYVINKS